MIDLKLDLEDVRRVKKNKQEMGKRLKQIDFDQSGLITVESFIAIAHKYSIQLSHQDVQYLKDHCRKNNQSSKILYVEALNSIKIKINSQGLIKWVCGGQNQSSPLRVKIEGLSSSRNSAIPNFRSQGAVKSKDMRKPKFPTLDKSMSPKASKQLQSLKRDKEQGQDLDFLMMPLTAKNGNIKVSEMFNPKPESDNVTPVRTLNPVNNQRENKDLTTSLPNIAKKYQSTRDNIETPREKLANISFKQKQEIKRQFKESQLDIKSLFHLKLEFSRRDIYSFSFSNDQELKYCIDNLNLHLPEAFITLIYDCTVNQETGKFNFVLLKQFIDTCQDTIMQEQKTNSLAVKTLLEEVEEESSGSLKQISKEIEMKLNQKYKSLQQAFRKFNVSKSGLISETEFIEGLVHLNVNLTEQEIRYLFNQLDLSGRGELNFEEFCTLIKKKPLNLNDLTSVVESNADQSQYKRQHASLQSRQSGGTQRTIPINKHQNSNYTFNRHIAKNRDMSAFCSEIESLSVNRQSRKLKIVGGKKKAEQGQVFGKKIEKSEPIDDIINNQYFNKDLSLRLRDKFAPSNKTNKASKKRIDLPEVAKSDNDQLSYIASQN